MRMLMLKKAPILIFIIVMVLLSGCTINNVNFIEKKDSGTLKSSYFLGEGGTIYVQNKNGSVKIENWDEGYVKLDYEKKANSFTDADLSTYLENTTVELIDTEDSVTITTTVPKITVGGVSVSMTMYVPKHVELDITTSNGSITVSSGVVGNAKLKSSNGGLNVNGLDGNFDLDTSNGSVKVNNVKGSGRIKTSNGSIYFESIEEVGNVDLTTSNGKIEMDLSKPVGESYKIKTSNGNIVVKVPEDMGFDLEASTSTGSIKTDLEGISGKDAKQEVNGGGFKLILETSNGTIYIN